MPRKYVERKVRRAPRFIKRRGGRKTLKSSAQGSFVHRYQRFAVDPAGIWMSGNTPGVTEYPLALDFQLNYISGIGDFTSLYDQYRINSVELRCR